MSPFIISPKSHFNLLLLYLILKYHIEIITLQIKAPSTTTKYK